MWIWFELSKWQAPQGCMSCMTIAIFVIAILLDKSVSCKWLVVVRSCWWRCRSISNCDISAGESIEIFCFDIPHILWWFHSLRGTYSIMYSTVNISNSRFCNWHCSNKIFLPLSEVGTQSISNHFPVIRWHEFIGREALFSFDQMYMHEMTARSI